MVARRHDERTRGNESVPYLLLGEVRANTLRQRLNGCVDAWQQDWFGRAVELEVVVMPAFGSQVGGTLCMALNDATHGSVLQVGVTSEFIPRLLRLPAMSALAGSSSLPSQLAAALQAEILQSLGEALLHLADLELPQSASANDGVEATGSADTRRWYQVNFTQLHSLERLSLLLHPVIIGNLVPMQPRVAGTLSSRRNVIVPQTVRVEAWLGEVKLTLHEFATLRLGDVLVLEHTHPAYLTAHHNQLRIATLQPGRRQSLRAVSIDSVLEESNLQSRVNTTCQ